MKKHTTRRALLMSVLSLLLCVSMLVGTTYAWFTDEVVSGMNTISAGNLDVELLADGKEVKADTKLFADTTLWEPGVVVYENLQIANKGTLALKYQMSLNFGNENDLGGRKLSEVLKVAVIDKITAGADRAEILAAAKAATNVGSLYDFFVAGELEANKATAEQGVVIFWEPGENDNLYNANNGKTLSEGEALYIEFGVNVQATQKMSESDSFGTDYDAEAKYDRDLWNGVTTTTPEKDAEGVYHITTAAELVGMMNDSKYPNCNKYQNVVLENNIDLNGATVPGFGDDSGFFDGIFDGQGYTISNFKIDASNRTYYAGLFNQVSQYSGENTVIKNLTVSNATVKGSGQVGAIVGGMNGNTVVDNCKVINSTLSGVKKVGAVVGYTAGGTVTNNYAENCTVLFSEKEGGEILGYENTGSTVANNTFKNVTVGQGVAISTADELVALGGTKAEGVIVLTSDIDMDGAAMPTIGAAYGKELTIVGNGYTISNATTAHTAHNGMKHHGFFFAYTNSKLTISDLTFENITIDATGDAERNYGAAIVVAYADGGSNVVLNNVDVKNSKVLNDTPDIGDEAGAYVGYQTGTLTMTDCDSTGCEIKGETAEKTGAFIGMVNGTATLNNCTTDLTIGACNRVGGTLTIN